MRLGAIAWRSLAARPLRTALTIIGVALGVAVLAATLVASQATDEAVRRAAQELYGSADLRVRAFDPAGFTPRGVSALRQVPGVLNAAAVSERRGVVSTTPSQQDRVFSVLFIGLDARDEAAIRSQNVADGVFLSADAPNGVLVNAAWARDNELGVGDELILTGHRQGVAPVRIVGLLDDAGFGALASGSVMVLNRDFLAEAFDFPVPVRYVDLQIAPGRSEDVQSGIDAVLTEPFVVETVADAEQQLARAQAGFSGIAFLFSLVAVAVGAFLVANTLAMTVAERMREIGLLRAAGTTSRQVLGIFLRQGAAIGLVGGIAGLLLGLGVATALIAFLRSTRAVLVTGIPFNAGAMGLAFVVGAVITLSAAALPALAAARVSPLEALSPSRQPGRRLRDRLPALAALAGIAIALVMVAYPLQRGDSSPLSLLLAVAVLVGGVLLVSAALQPLAALVGRPFAWFFGATGLLGRANLGRDRVRTGLTVGALAIGLAAVVALSAVSASARATAERWVSSILPGGYALRLLAADEIENLRPQMEAITGTEAATPIVEVPAVVVRSDVIREAWVAGIDPSIFQDTGSLIFVQGRRSQAFEALRQGGAVLVPEPVAQRDGLAVGDIMQLAIPGGETSPFSVAGVVAYSLPTETVDGALMISLRDARRVFGATTAELWALVPRGDVSDSAYRAAVDAASVSLTAEPLTAATLADELGRSLNRLIGLFDVLALLAVVIGGLGIVNTLAMGVVERGREIAILRSHGMTVRQVQAMVVSEAAILGAVGGLAAVVIGLLVAWTTVSLGAPRDFTAGLAIPWAVLAIVVLLGIGVASAAGVYPARSAASGPVTEALKHFE
ncbi:MAG TPA: FtsX-like permease family protein [Candidatus Limnocylindrales bacterium]|nr:FtsX-like permease family protein [Candidatus Limnocylindrales bacterium]